jgi:hypothetical protein
METRADSEVDADALPDLDDPEFFRHWADLRLRIALSGKAVPCELKRKYAVAAAEFRRRVHQSP